MVQHQIRPRPQGHDKRHRRIEPRTSEPVYVPFVPLLPLGLHERIESRHLAVSADGRSVAFVQRGPGSSLSVAHADPTVPLSSVPFDEAMIVQVYPQRGVKIWADRGGERGIWMVTPQGARLCARLDAVRKIVHGPYGNIPVGDMGRDASVHVVRDSPIVLPRGAELVFGNGEHPHTLLPIGTGPSKRWLHPPAPRRDLPDDWAGDAVWPLPFTAERVQMFLHHGQPLYLLRDGNGDAFWSDGHLTRITPEGSDGGVDYIWTPPDGNAVATLLRVAGPKGNVMRRLLVDGESVYEGAFFMRHGGFRWSSNGRHFVAHLTRTDHSGDQAEEVLVTRGATVSVSRPATVHEPRVDDLGRLAYVLEDQRGRHVVADGTVSPAYPYAWNLSQTSDAVVANVLTHGRIHRVEFSHGR